MNKEHTSNKLFSAKTSQEIIELLQDNGVEISYKPIVYMNDGVGKIELDIYEAYKILMNQKDPFY